MDNPSISFPPTEPVRILIADDNVHDAELMVAALRDAGYSISFDLVSSRDSYQRQLACQEYDAILCDHNLLDWTGRDAFNILRATKKDIPFVVVTAALGDEAAVEYVKSGANDYILKDRLERLPMAVWHALCDKRQQVMNAALQGQRKRLEAQLLQAQKMEVVGRLAGGIAHDFNNILGVILGYADLMLREDGLTASGQEHAEEITAAVQTAASVTRQLLTFTGKHIQQSKVMNLNDLISETRSLLARLIGEDIQLETNLNAVTAGVRADPAQIQQALMNLAVNGRDAMPAGGRLLIETSNVTADQPDMYAEAGGNAETYILLSVTDTGCGMDSAVMAHLFEPFFTTKERGKGTGLGLSTVFGTVSQSGGKISVLSQTSRGTTFRLYFPTVQQPVTEEFPAPLLVTRGSETILLVEDEPRLRMLTRVQLEAHGYHVLEAISPENAAGIARTFEGTIHLLLTDVVMPGASGAEVASCVRGIRPDTKVLFVTGYFDSLTAGAQTPDAVPVLQKPFTGEQLVRTIQGMLKAGASILAPGEPAA